eukprot:5159440-Pleurochrysis_carterae.AAC.1
MGEGDNNGGTCHVCRTHNRLWHRGRTILLGLHLERVLKVHAERGQREVGQRECKDRRAKGRNTQQRTTPHTVSRRSGGRKRGMRGAWTSEEESERAHRQSKDKPA